MFPVSIETAVYNRLARNANRSPEVTQVRGSLEGTGSSSASTASTIPRASRIASAPSRRFLEANPEWRGRLTLLQITPKSRAEIKEYAEIEAEVTGLIGRINGRFGDAAWTPIRYINKSYSRTALAGILSLRRRRHGDAAARRNESRRQGIPRRARPE